LGYSGESHAAAKATFEKYGDPAAMVAARETGMIGASS
jgi:hypothetical protein